MLLDLIVALGAIAAIISALPALGIDIRIFGRKKHVIALSSATTSKWRWWLVMAVACLSLSGTSYNWYRARRLDVESWQSHTQETIYAKSYRNEIVELDGKIFDHCHFENVKLHFHGRAPFGFNQSDFGGEVWLGTDNIAIRNYISVNAAIEKLGVKTHLVCTDSHGNPISDPSLAPCPQ